MLALMLFFLLFYLVKKSIALVKYGLLKSQYFGFTKSLTLLLQKFNWQNGSNFEFVHCFSLFFPARFNFLLLFNR